MIPNFEYGSGVHVQNLNFHYQYEKVLNNINGLFPKNSMTAIVGPNGAGKTTLLKILAGLIQPNSGQICYHGFSFKPKVSYLRQSHNLDREFPLTVYEAVFLGSMQTFGWHQKSTPELEDRCQSVLDKVKMLNFSQHSLNDLSYGQLQRVFLARFLVEDGDILLLDEPFNFVDEPTVNVFIEILQELKNKGKTIIVVLHDLEVARNHFENVLVLSRKLIGWGKTSETLTLESWNEALFHART